MDKKIYYVENQDFNENWITIKEGFLIKVFKDENGCKVAMIRENVDKYRPEHFHDIYLDNIKIFEQNDEIDFLNDIAEIVHSRLEDLFYNLKDIKK